MDGCLRNNYVRNIIIQVNSKFDRTLGKTENFLETDGDEYRQYTTKYQIRVSC